MDDRIGRDHKEGKERWALTLLTGSANPVLGTAVAAELRLHPGRCLVERFPDSELHIQVQESVRGQDVYLVQPTSPPVETHLLELILMADACRRAGAGRITAVVPYFGYARQDRRATGREPVGARVVADLLATGGLQRVVALDLHTAAIEGFFRLPLEHVSAVPVLAEAVRPHVPADGVVVAPDLGATKLAERYATLLDRPVAIVHKTRLSGEAVRAGTITGDVRQRAPVIVDDMISTGGTIEAAVMALLAAGCRPEVTVVASHGLFVGAAQARLRRVPVQRFIVTDSVHRTTEATAANEATETTSTAAGAGAAAGLPVQVQSIAPLLAQTIARLHREQSLGDLIAHG